ncbi:MAG TPA: hypothetical protein VME43_27825 [Bryobacteraceae bacterium]|nr:hypothetical protein [Bryobacteraceae bacterium]
MVQRKLVLIGGILLLAAAPVVFAQSNTAEVFGGYDYSKLDPETNLPRVSSNGWAVSAAALPTKWFGVGIEVSAVFGNIPIPSGITAPDLHEKEYSYLVGPQFRFLNKQRVQSQVKMYVGGAFSKVSLDANTTAGAISQLGAAGYNDFTQTKFAAMLAIPVDVAVTKLIAIRVEPAIYLTNFNESGQGNFRVSIGPVFRFGNGR